MSKNTFFKQSGIEKKKKTLWDLHDVFYLMNHKTAWKILCRLHNSGQIVTACPRKKSIISINNIFLKEAKKELNYFKFKYTFMQINF